jgi:hypothetical protein
MGYPRLLMNSLIDYNSTSFTIEFIFPGSKNKTIILLNLNVDEI